MDAVTSELCDVCRSRAYVRTIIIPDHGLALTWCKHDYERFELELIARKYPVMDHRYELETAVRPAKPKPRP